MMHNRISVRCVFRQFNNHGKDLIFGKVKRQGFVWDLMRRKQTHFIEKIKMISLLFLLASTLATTAVRPTRSMQTDDPCLDSIQADLSTIESSPRYTALSKPWERKDVPLKAYKSAGLDYQWIWAKNLPIRGLSPATTTDDIVRWLDSLNCSFSAFGNVVWQSIQRAKPITIQAEISCPLEMIYSKCVKRFGPPSCGLFPLEEGGWGAYRLEIGDATANTSLDAVRLEPLQLFEYGYFHAIPARKWGYTVCSMMIHDDLAGHVYVLDMSGHGFLDVCDKRIAPAENTEEWIQEDLKKLLRFYKLRGLGFSPTNEIFEARLNTVIGEKFNKKDAQTFYCTEMLAGVVSWAGEYLTTACHLIYPQQRAVHQIASAREIMQKELGPVWVSKIGPAIDEMEAVYITDRVLVEVRNRLLHRVAAGAIPTPRVATIQPGKPLANDISEVHRRPILHKGTVNHQLPKDFPSGPLAIPDINLEFQPQHEPEGAGYNDPMAYDMSAASYDSSVEQKEIQHGKIVPEKAREFDHHKQKLHSEDCTKMSTQDLLTPLLIFLLIFLFHDN